MDEKNNNHYNAIKTLKLLSKEMAIMASFNNPSPNVTISGTAYGD